MTLQIGLTWPTPGPDNPPPEPAHFAQIRAGGFDALRINLDHRRSHANVTDWIDALEAADLEPLVILDGDYDAPDVLALADMAAWLADTFHLEALEVLNEPWILHKMPARTYAAIVNEVGAALAGTGTQVVLAAEATTPICQRVPFYGRVVPQLERHAWQVWGIHPYRNPQGPETSRKGWDRTTEHVWYLRQAQGRPIWWTETGWNLSGNTLEEQAAYTVGELDAAMRLEVPLVCFYAMVGEGEGTAGSDWGFWDGATWEERPVVQAVRNWRAAHL